MTGNRLALIGLLAAVVAALCLAPVAPASALADPAAPFPVNTFIGTRDQGKPVARGGSVAALAALRLAC